jgi:hypothetical protein
MPKLIDRISKDLNQTGYHRRSTEARAWLQNKARQLGQVNRIGIVNDPVRTTGGAAIGKMFFFFYDPKLKLTLPYYDKFPLVLPIELYSDGFLGLNFHYLPINLRIVLLDKLYDLTNNDKFDNSTRIQASYQILSSASRYKEFKPCLKRYLAPHIASRMVEIEAQEWETAIFLNVQNFAKASAQQVWADSREQI